MDPIVRKGVPADLPRVLELIKELALYEKSPESVAMTVAELEREGFGTRPSYELLVAELNGTIRGIAIFYYCFSTWRGKYLYLEDLIVEEAYRSRGLGAKLFLALVDRAKSEGLRQMGWQVLDWNKPAIKFYKKIGASLDAEWLNGRLYFE